MNNNYNNNNNSKVKEYIYNHKDEVLKSIGNVLRKEREEKGLSRKSLADRIDLSENYIGYIEQGKYNISFLKFLLITTELEVNPNYIIRSALNDVTCEKIDFFENHEKDIAKEILMYLKGF